MPKIFIFSLLSVWLVACSGGDAPQNPELSTNPTAAEITADEPPQLTPTPSEAIHLAADAEIIIDGSSTVFPITEVIAGELERLSPGVKIRLGVSGTGGGFKKFCKSEIDIANASRPIKSSEEAVCRKNGVELVELPIAFDGISVVVHHSNLWAGCLTLQELEHLWSPDAEGVVLSWNDVRDEWPDRPLKLFAPGKDSGTFDYFTYAVNGHEGIGRSDFNASEDDYLLAQGIARDPNAIGFFGYAYYREYSDQLRLVAVDQGAGCVEPSEQTIANGTYRPLSRPIFIYVGKAALDRQEVRAFVDLYLNRATEAVTRSGYIPLPERVYALARERVAEPRLGSVFDGGSQIGVSIEELLAIETEG